MLTHLQGLFGQHGEVSAGTIVSLPSLMTSGAAATLLGVTPRTVQRWCNEGRLQAVLTEGGHHRIDEAVLRAFLLRRHPPRRRPPRAAHAKRQRRPWRVLVVEDDLTQCAALARMLRLVAGDQVTVHVENDGFGAGLSVASNPPDLMLLDLEVPTIDGFDLLRRLRFAPGLERMLVVIYSGNITVERRRELQVLGVQEVWGKPLSPSEVRGRITGLLQTLEATHAFAGGA